MKIDAINIYKVALPFKFSFSHARKTAESVDNIVVELIGPEQKLRGYGEGGPRPYVTGETQDSAIEGIRHLTLNSLFPWDLHDVKQVWEFIDHAMNQKGRNSVLCALEMALLDLLGRKEGCNILAYLSKDHIANEIRYGGTVPIADHETVTTMCEMLKSFGIYAVRLKMGRDFRQNQKALEDVRKVFGTQCDLRVDVNGGWNLQLALLHLPLLESQGVSVLEQPLPPNDKGWRDLAALGISYLKFMADESVCSIQDVEEAIADGFFHIVNVRLSKCGGFANSLKIIRRLRDAGLEFQVGCQLGESGILSAAGRALGVVNSDALYYDGSYDAFLLTGNLTTEHVTFSHGGLAGPLTGPGLGITVSRHNLQRFSHAPFAIQRP
jgi:L-alanine-DL-glutamate epimerase-like enolase superfamily enzyme